MKQNNNAHIEKRMIIFKQIVLLLFFFLILKLFIVQIMDHQAYLALENNQTTVYIEEDTARGEIYDTNSNLIVGNTENYNIAYINSGAHGNKEK